MPEARADKADKLTNMLADEIVENTMLRQALRDLSQAVWDYDNNSPSVVAAARRADKLLENLETEG